MTREEAIQWLKVINTKKFGWDEFALQESQREIRERCEQGVREAIDMATEALNNSIDMAIEALNNSIQMSNIQQLQAENGVLKEMIKFYREQQTVELVRCKDCRYCTEYYDRDGYPYWECAEWDGGTDADGFCHYGERSEP